MFQLIIVATLLISARGQDPPDTSTARPTTTSSPPPETCTGANEIYLAQGVAPNCDTVCSEIGKPCTKQYIQQPSGCYCLPDHARNASNVCVPISECKIACHPHSNLLKMPDMAMLALLAEVLKSKQPPKPLVPSLDASPLPEPALLGPSNPLSPDRLLPPKLSLSLQHHQPLLPELEPSPLKPSFLEPSLLDHLRFSASSGLHPPHLPLPLPLPHPLPPPPPGDCQNSPQAIGAISAMSSMSSMSSVPELELQRSHPLLPSLPRLSLPHPPQLQGSGFSYQYHLP